LGNVWDATLAVAVPLPQSGLETTTVVVAGGDVVWVAAVGAAVAVAVWVPAAGWKVFAGADVVGGWVPGVTGASVAAVVLVDVFGFAANTCPSTWGFPLALVDDPESSETKCPIANPPANTPMAMDPATIGDGSLNCPPLPLRQYGGVGDICHVEW
jgi:hypothetical protein